MDDINLLPGDFILRRRRLTRLRAWLGVVIILLLVLPLSLIITNRHLMDVERRLAFLEYERQELKQRIDQLKELRDHQRALRNRAQTINMLRYRIPLQQVFFDVANLTDDQIWLTQLQLRRVSKSRGVPHRRDRSQRPTSFFTLGHKPQSETGPVENHELGSMSLTLKGFTTSNHRLADFMSGLNGLKHFSKVNLQVSRRGLFQGYKAIEFAIEMRL